MKRNDKIKIAIILLTALTVLSLVIPMLFNSLNDKPLASGIWFGLFDHDSHIQKQPPLLSQEDLEQEYDSRAEYPQNFLNEMERQATIQLSKGAFTEFDKWLATAQKTYKQPSNNDTSYEGIIDDYRSALVIGKELEKNTLSEHIADAMQNCTDPLVLASVLLSTPPSTQIEVFIAGDSLITPVLTNEDRESLSITEVFYDDFSQRLEYFNLRRSEEGKFQKICHYQYSAFDRTWEMTIGMNQNATYSPISLYIIDNPPLYPITLTDMITIAAFLSDPQLDKILNDEFTKSLDGKTAVHDSAPTPPVPPEEPEEEVEVQSETDLDGEFNTNPTSW